MVTMEDFFKDNPIALPQAIKVTLKMQLEGVSSEKTITAMKHSDRGRV